MLLHLTPFAFMPPNRLRFPWFTLTDAEGETDAYTHFIASLCAMAQLRKRVTAKEREVENDKFAMRLFLVRLGFIGAEDKKARKILLRNLTGNTAWKYGRRPEMNAVDANNDAENVSAGENIKEV